MSSLSGKSEATVTLSTVSSGNELRELSSSRGGAQTLSFASAHHTLPSPSAGLLHAHPSFMSLLAPVVPWVCDPSHLLFMF